MISILAHTVNIGFSGQDENERTDHLHRSRIFFPLDKLGVNFFPLGSPGSQNESGSLGVNFFLFTFSFFLFPFYLDIAK